jgi:hypothetical protein
LPVCRLLLWTLSSCDTTPENPCNPFLLHSAGKPLHAYAGKEISRALALDSTSEADVGSDSPKGLQPEQEQRLEAALAEYAAKYDEVGQVRATPGGVPCELSSSCRAHDWRKLDGLCKLLALVHVDNDSAWCTSMLASAGIMHHQLWRGSLSWMCHMWSWSPDGNNSWFHLHAGCSSERHDT